MFTGVPDVTQWFTGVYWCPSVTHCVTNVYRYPSVTQYVTGVYRCYTMCDRCLQVSINRGASSLSELGGDTLGFPITQRVLSVEDRDSPDDSLLYVLSSAPSHGYIINRALGNRSISNWTQGNYLFLLTSLTAVSIVSCLSRLWVAFVCLLLLLCVCFTLCLCLSHSLSLFLSISLSLCLTFSLCVYDCLSCP